jgi:hypothetical protein
LCTFLAQDGKGLLRSERLRDIKPIRQWRTHEGAVAAMAIHSYVKLRGENSLMALSECGMAAMN